MKTQKLLSYLRQCIKKYDMIHAGDRIAVGLSGGKDSLTLLYGLKRLQSFYPVPFELVAIYVNLGWNQPEDAILQMRTFCEKLGVPFYPVDTEIYSIVFDERKEKNPCSLCAKMRKGALNAKALELNCKTIAYAHHSDDFMETSLMSLFYNGKYYCFPPVTYMEDTGLTVIRPMFYISENEIRGFAAGNQLPVISNPCPADGYTKRQEMKEFIAKSKEQFPDIRKNLHTALETYFEEEKDKMQTAFAWVSG